MVGEATEDHGKVWVQYHQFVEKLGFRFVFQIRTHGVFNSGFSQDIALLRSFGWSALEVIPHFHRVWDPFY